MVQGLYQIISKYIPFPQITLDTVEDLFAGNFKGGEPGARAVLKMTQFFS
jgi:hypothetical protein